MFPGIPPNEGCCAWAAAQILPGFPPYGDICALELLTSGSTGAQLPDQLEDASIRRLLSELTIKKFGQGFPPLEESVRMGSAQ